MSSDEEDVFITEETPTIEEEPAPIEEKTNKKGKEVKSSLGHYITARSKENNISVLINGFSCMFFINDKKVTYLWSGLK